jgi:3-phenylpropionate/trans-cinnamate dioxygenase ferredoxin reductase subunit
MSGPQTHVIVGAGLAGAKAAETLRAEGFDGRVVLFGDEAERPYERPPLSKQFLRGESAVEDVFVHEPGYYEAHDIELRTGDPVRAIEPADRLVHPQNGEPVRYDRLLLATGSRPRTLPVPGADLEGVHHLRDLDDSRSLHAALGSASRLAVVGGGWIGTEVAASARRLGVDVALIDPGPVPLAAALGAQVGGVYRDLHAEHGVDLYLGQTVDELVGDGRVNGVRTGDGTTIAADLVVVGIGAVPRVELAREAGMDVEGGIVVDEWLRTATPGVYAAGDVAAAWHPRLGRRLRVEHWANALNQGVTAARNMLGAEVPYDRVPYFFSDQYDLGMEYLGHAPGWAEVVFRGDPATREFIAFWLDGGQVVATMNANVWDVTDPLRGLIEDDRRADPARLADPHVPLAEVHAVTTG